MRKKIRFYLLIILIILKVFYFSSTLANRNTNNYGNEKIAKENSEYPPFLPDKTLKNGGIILAFLIAIYCFTLLAIVCDKYFIPSIERMCDILNISADVAAATFMSVATSCPELFTNLFATFLLGNNLGIGTVVGSSMFNALGVASAGALAAIHVSHLWPVKMALRLTVPNPKLHPHLWALTFLLCIFWIGLNSYIVTWMASLIGSCFSIPSSVQGLTFVAAGGSLPECMSIVIMTRRGEGKMGVSNSLGANSMNILFSLGMPWFFRTLTLMHNVNGVDGAFLTIDSAGIVYSIIGLLFVAVILYVTLALSHFTLSKRTGVILVSIYFICLVLACVMETVIFPARP